MDPAIISIIISGVALLTSVCSTVLIAIANNRHALKLKKIELYEKRKYEVIENYLKKVGSIIFLKDTKIEEDVFEWLSEIFMYVPEAYWNDIEDLNAFVRNCIQHEVKVDERTAAKDKYLLFCKKISHINRKHIGAN